MARPTCLKHPALEPEDRRSGWHCRGCGRVIVPRDPPERGGEPVRSRSVRSFETHSRAITALAFHPDGRRVISASEDRTLQVRDVETATCLQVLSGHTGNVTSVAADHDARHVVSVAFNTTLKRWDLERGACERTVKVHRWGVSSVALQPEGRAVTGAWDNTVRVWDLADGSCLRTLDGHLSGVVAVASHPDGVTIVSASVDGVLKRWEPGESRCLTTLHAAQGIEGIALGSDGRRLLLAGASRVLEVWDLATSARVLALEGHRDVIRSVAIDPGGRFAVSVSWDRTARLWDLDQGVCAGLWVGEARLTACAFSPGGHAVFDPSRPPEGGYRGAWRAASQGGIVVGDETGRLWLIEWEG